MKRKNNWGGIRKENEMIKKYHEQWAKKMVTEIMKSLMQITHKDLLIIKRM